MSTDRHTETDRQTDRIKYTDIQTIQSKVKKHINTSKKITIRM